MRRLALAALAALAALGVVACAPQSVLTGSLSEVFPLDISSIQILRNAQAFQVTYYVNDGPNVDIVARLSVSLQGVTLVPGKSIPLAGEYAPGHQRATVIHQPSGEAALLLPDIARGDLTVRSGGAPGQKTTGDFAVSFFQSTALGGGRTLNGAFTGTPQDAGYGPGL